MPLLDHTGNAPTAQLTADFGAAALTAQCDDLTNWPLGGAAGKFYVTFRRNTAGEERTLAASRSGNVLTFSGLGDRGLEGTSAVLHPAGSTVEHTYSMQEAEDANSHVFDTTRDDHSQYFNSARHAGTVHTQAMLGTDSVGAAQIIAGAVGTSELAADAVDATKIATGAVGNTEIATDAVDAAKILAGAVGSSELAANAVIAGKIGAGAISELADFATGIRPYYTQVADPGAVGNGILWFDLTNRQIKVRDAANTGWELFGELIQPMVDYTPNFPMVTLGTGGHKYGRYWRLGNLIVGIAGFTLGSSGNVTSTIKLDVPHSLVQPGSERFSWMAGGRAVDASAGATYAGIAMIDHSVDATSYSGFATAGSSANWDQNTPMDWVDSDHFHGFFFGEKV